MNTPSQKMEMFTGNANYCETQSIIDSMILSHLYIYINIIMLALYFEANQIVHEHSKGPSVYIIS